MFLTQKDIISLIINKDFRYLSRERQQEIFREIRKRLISYYKNTNDNLICNLNIGNQENTNFTIETSLLLIVILETYGEKFLKNWLNDKLVSEEQKDEWLEKTGEILIMISSAKWNLKDDMEMTRKEFISEILLLEEEETYIFSKIANTIFNLTLDKFESDEIVSMKNELEKMVRLFEHLTEEGKVEFIKKGTTSARKINQFLTEILEQEIKEYKNFRML